MSNLQSELESAVRIVDDFPIKDVRFRDIAPVLANPELFDFALNQMVTGIDLTTVDAFAGIESRGFILGAALSSKFQKGFIPIRKAGKIPPPVISQSYQLEYAHATLEMSSITPPARSRRVVLIDDVLATGGTLSAAISLCERAGLQIVDVRVLIDITALNQFKFRDSAIEAVIRV